MVTQDFDILQSAEARVIARLIFGRDGQASHVANI